MQPAVDRFVQSDRRRVRRRKPAAIHSRGAVTSDGGTYPKVPRIVRIDGNRPHRPVVSRSKAAWNQDPMLTAVGGLVQPEPRFGVAGAVLLSGSYIHRRAAGIRRIIENRTNGVSGKSCAHWAPLWGAGQHICRLP